ncbi:MAG: flagellar protein FlgN [Dehalococcoidia bacterium]|nr:flagellar protein FlgN [Dehalococcoidia bacterium]MCA9855872.1 flagellar protein FlgN [Dehalococcoidia bacterium]MCB9492055.1 flagellar protein FlgN [Dehalococcoidia bacterium]
MTPLQSRGQELTAGAATLGDVLAGQRDLYRALVGIASNEQAAIVDGDVERLTELVEQKENILDHLRAMETERMTALVAIEMATGIAAEGATISEIAAHLPAASAEELQRLGRELKAEAVALEEAHAVNARLLRNSRALIDRWIHYLRSVLAGSLYTSDGDNVAVAGGRTLDRSA